MTDPSPDCGYTVGRLVLTETEQTLWEEILRLREFGEHYSGAAQDAWDRIVVLEKALREVISEVPVGNANVHRHADLQDLHKRVIGLLGLPNPGQFVPSHYWIDAPRTVSPGGAAEPCPSCGPDGTNQIHFDRSLCACGSMHHYCDVCGLQTEDCDDHPAAAPVSTEPTP